jgi:hypothetical protein
MSTLESNPRRATDNVVVKFKLLIDPPSQISELADRYHFPDDSAALAAGASIRQGEHKRANLLKIFEWKTRGRGRSRLERNTDDEIADALALAIKAKTDRAALAVLRGLDGIEIPVASAALTAIDPERFTIIDFRALEALGIRQANITIDFYLAYLSHCRRLAHENKVSLRMLDRALWQWSKENSDGATPGDCVVGANQCQRSDRHLYRGVITIARD